MMAAVFTCGSRRTREMPTRMRSRVRKPGFSGSSSMVSAETWDWGLIRIFRSQKHARGRQIAGSSGTTIDPLHAKLTQRLAPVANGRTFWDVAEEFTARKEAGWRNPKHRQQWRR